jgi:hypothetical protein
VWATPFNLIILFIYIYLFIVVVPTRQSNIFFIIISQSTTNSYLCIFIIFLLLIVFIIKANKTALYYCKAFVTSTIGIFNKPNKNNYFSTAVEWLYFIFVVIAYRYLLVNYFSLVKYQCASVLK